MRVLSVSTRFDGRFLVIGIVAFSVLFVGSITLIFNSSLSDVFHGLGVPAMDPHFGDLLGVAAGIEGHDAGIDIRQPNPFDPWHRAYNLPSAWLGMKYLGFNRGTIVPFGFGITALFLGSVWFVLGPLRPLGGVFAGLFLISPVVVTGMERANVDLIVFFVVSVALAFRRRLAFAVPALLFATLLKVYPFGTLIVLFSPPFHRARPWIAGVFAVLALYVLLDWHELRAVAASTPQFPIFSYGLSIFGVWLSYLNVQHPQIAYDIGVFWGAFFFLLAVALAIKFGPRATPDPECEREHFSFQLGAGIYLVSFAVGVSNDYRMIFLIFCLPLLFHLQARPTEIRGWARSALLCGLLYVNWDLFSDELVVRHLLFKQALAWGLVASLVGLLAGTRSWPIQAFAISPLTKPGSLPQTTSP